jgi:hypothetical protein
MNNFEDALLSTPAGVSRRHRAFTSRARMNQERPTSGSNARRATTDEIVELGIPESVHRISGRRSSGSMRAIPTRSIDDVRERSFYPRPHERHNTFRRRLSNWLRARVGLGPKS